MDISSVSGLVGTQDAKNKLKAEQPVKEFKDSTNPDIKVTLSEEAKTLSKQDQVGVRVVDNDIAAFRARLQEKSNVLDEHVPRLENTLLQLDTKIEDFTNALSETNPELADKAFDFTVRENGTLKVIGDSLSERERVQLEGILNEDSQLVQLATDLKESTLATMSKAAGDKHSYDEINLEGIAINDKSLEAGLQVKSLLQGMKSDYARYGSEANTEAAFGLSLYGIAKELSRNLG